MLLKSQREQLMKNAIYQAAAAAQDQVYDPQPVVKFFYPAGAATWLISEMDEDGRMFGLCDLGHGTPELGYVMFDELTSFKGRFGLGIERDMHWTPAKTLSEYADEARQLGRIAA